MQITEIYKSLQGKSSFAGIPCIFVRLTGCNLRCTWCDSEFTFTGGSKMTAEQVHAEIAKLAPVRLIEFTGGEPMLQERELVPLMQRLLDEGYELLIETSGERPLANVPKAVHKIVDVKCPDSGAPDTFRPDNLEALTGLDEIKFVISSRRDYEFARDFTLQHSLATRVNAVIFSPAFRKDAGLTSLNGARESRSVEHCLVDPRLLAEWILADALNVRLGFQIHK